MPQFDFVKTTDAGEFEIEHTDVMTGDRNKNRFLYYQLKMSMQTASKIDIIVSFLMESGVRMILKDLKAALDRGVPVRILTGNYLGITQPSALYLIKKELGDRVDLRFYNDKGRSFHPKAYIFHYNNMGEIYIGSSNISRSALTSGIEWNYRFNSLGDKKNFELFYAAFVDLFENHSLVIDDRELVSYSRSWHKPAVSKDLARYDELEDFADAEGQPLFQPRGAQIEALYALQDSRAEGATKGLVQAATGVGKTYLAAFDSAQYERVLFVAHREEILKQAAMSFRNVRRSDDYGFFYGKQKDTDRSVIFASVATLGRSEYLTEEYFAPDYFDYLVIDEFHHAVNEQYQRIVNYFKPQFFLGLTATPERLDGKNIYEICDYNVPYEISLKDAINKGVLVPFHYYGIYDETDYSSLHLVQGRYDERELNETYIGNVKRYDLIFKHYMKYRSKRALGFCCSRKHAEEMAKEFCRRGIAAAAKLKNQDTSRGKKYLNVLDFIGNYEKAGRAPLLLSGAKALDERTAHDYSGIEYPDDCIVDFDMRLIDLFREIDRKSLSVKERIRQEFYRVKELLDGKVPSRMELFTYIDDAVYQYCVRHAKENPFRRYLDFLYEMNELSATEQEVYPGIGREFLALIETTDMQKVYKIPMLYSFYHDGDIRLAVKDGEVLAAWKGFFIEKACYAIAIREDLRPVIGNAAFKAHMKDILEYRTMEYYRRRYEK